MDRMDAVMAAIKQDMPHHLSLAYERIAQEIMRENAETFPPFDRLGKWWDRNEEIDITGINKERNLIFCAEVKWTEKPVGTNILGELKAKAERITWGNKKTARRFALFSKKGFTREMLEAAGRDEVVLFRGTEKVST
ncbi:MAG: hypothetical protein HZA01_05570 [Nitrospinae bacterium]|nr:hypothetical protein [Nitrospinota bacterium]